MRSHREMYPEQYKHPLCGKQVRVVHQGREIKRGTVQRVMPTRFGPMAALEDFAETLTGYRTTECEVL